jgi:hypothetical protein
VPLRNHPDAKLGAGNPIRTGVYTEAERMILWETKIIGGSLVHERQRAARLTVPGVCWKQIECGL